MSTTTTLTWPRVTRSELVKSRSLGSHWGLLLAAVLTTGALGAIQSVGLLMQARATGRPGAATPADAVAAALSGVSLATLLVAVLGVVVVTAEYGSRSIRITFAAVPRRGLVVVGKAAALAAAGTAALVPTVLATWEVARRVLDLGGPLVGWTDPGVVRALLGAVALMVGWGLVGTALGWLVRSALGASFLLLALMFLAPALVGVIPGGAALVPWLPSEVSQALLRVDPGDGPAGPVLAPALWAAYVVAALALGWWRVEKHDA